MPKADDFDEFYATSSRRLVGQLFAMTGDLNEAEDAVQEAYLRAWQRWPRIQGYHDREAWIRTVAYRISVNAWSKARNRLTAHHRAGRHAEQPEISPDLLMLVSALRKITESQRRVIVLHHLVGLSIEEIAAETGAPPGTVKARLARGRKALVPLVSDFDETPTSRTHPAGQRRETTPHA
ncbi:MAG TPA: SigE family RNA polymerase sigma factor [Trebonia sp.]|nr:SigE family RNA polymerase sigma factor [Trebonia sp.]